MASTNPLLNLPLELIFATVAEDVLTTQDLKNLRLAHRTLARTIAPKLFAGIMLNFNPRIEPVTISDMCYSESEDDGGGPASAKSIDFGSLEYMEDDPSKRRKRRLPRSSINDRMRDLLGKGYTAPFLNAPRKLVIKYESCLNLDESVINFVGRSSTFKILLASFPRLRDVELSLGGLEDMSDVSEKLARRFCRLRVRGKKVLDTRGVVKSSCLRQIEDLSALNIHQARPIDDAAAFVDDLAAAIGRCPNLTRLDLGTRSYDNLGYSVIALVARIPDDNLKKLKSLSVFLDQESTDFADIVKMESLEKLTVYEYEVATASGAPPQKSVWDHLLENDMKLSSVTVNKVDESLAKYVLFLDASLLHLCIDMDSQTHLFRARNDVSALPVLSEFFWLQVFPRLGGLKSLTVVSACHSDFFQGGETVYFEMPNKDPDLLRDLRRLEKVDVSFRHEAGKLALALSLVSRCEAVARIRLRVTYPTPAHGPGVRDPDPVDTEGIVGELTKETTEWAPEGGSVGPKRGAFLCISLSYRFAFGSRNVKFRYRPGKWHLSPDQEPAWTYPRTRMVAL